MTQWRVLRDRMRPSSRNRPLTTMVDDRAEAKRLDVVHLENLALARATNTASLVRK
jgi:hypothetical protein